MNVFVIGAGASGMVAAITSARCGAKVTLIEKNNVLGKKLLLTGNGRCNYFNEDMSISNFYSDGDVSKIINDTNIEKLKKFHDSIGLIPRIKDGYYYPLSNQATAIQNSLVKELSLLNVSIINDEVIDIIKEDKFIIKGVNKKYIADKVIISTGGITYPKTGSNGSFYQILEKMGHHIVNLGVALTPMITDSNVKDWSGIRCNVNLKLHTNDNVIEESGEAQLTDYGISGICVMNISRFVDKKSKNILEINFLPNIDNLYDFIEERNKKLPNRAVIELLEVLVNYKLLYFIMRKLHLNTNMKWQELSKKEKDLLVENITSYKLNIIDTKDAMYGETTKGGVSLSDLTSTCESKIIKNLFITGELIDIDGKCGGYNLTNAFITGILAGETND